MNSTLTLTQEWDKTFPQNAAVDHCKVTFHNRFGIELAEVERGGFDLLSGFCFDGVERVRIEDFPSLLVDDDVIQRKA